MSQNPYEASTTTASSRTHTAGWMIATGAVSLGVAVLCVVATVVMMMWSLDAVASSSTATNPSVLAGKISTSVVVPGIAAVTLSLIGIVLLILGYTRRNTVTNS